MRARVSVLGIVASIVIIAGCGTSTDVTTQPTPGLQAVIVSSEVLVGKNERLPIGILDRNTPVTDATVRVRVFYLGNNGAAQKGEFEAPFKGGGLNGAGVYVAAPTFDIAGSWRADVTALRPNGDHGVTSLPFNVLASAVVPAPGQPAPRTHNQTTADVPDISYIDSGNPPDDMHAISIADAIAQHKPTLVIFASPAFCTSRICGPEVDVVKSLEPDYQGKLTFIHVEVYTNIKPDPSKKTFAQPVIDWRLQSEPWVFLIDSSGIIKSRYEGPAAKDELKSGIDALLASG